MLRLKRLMSSQIRLRDLAPTVVVEDDLACLQIGVPVVVRVVIMMGEIPTPSVLEGVPTARPDVLGVGRKKLRPPTAHQGRTRLIHVGPGDAERTAHARVVGTADAFTAGIPRGEQIVISPMLDQRRPLDGASPARGEGIDRGIRGELLAGVGVNGDHLDAGPEGSESQPRVPVRVHEQVRVDAVVIVRGTALYHQAPISPQIIGRGGIQRGIGSHTDHRIVGAKRRTGVIDPVKSVIVADARSPNIRDGGPQGRVHPARHGRHDVASGLPIHFIGGLTDL